MSQFPSNSAHRSTLVGASVLVGVLLLGGAGSSEAGWFEGGGARRDATSGSRPKTALVLSGGGARGAAHIGVLKVLEELKVRPDLIVGTSMGAIVGGLYATGWRPDEIEIFLRDLDWSDVFIDRVDRADKSFRRKQDDQIYLVQAKLRFKGWKPYLPTGVLGGQRLEVLLRSLEIVSTAETDFDAFAVPFRAVAADIETGEAVVIGRGSLAQAMRASMSIAGVFSPVEIAGRSLVDGGAAANLPIRIARSLGAERIIAVDISSPLEPEAELRSFVSILNQVSSFLTVGNRADDVAALEPEDVLLVPDLGDVTFTDFARSAEAISLGEVAARDAGNRLRVLAVSDEEWEVFRSRHRQRPRESTVIDSVRIRNESVLDDEVVRRGFRLPLGETFDPEALRRGVARLAALDVFGTIQPRWIEEDGDGVLDVRVPRKPYGRNSLQFGLSLQDDFEGGGTYGLTARHVLLPANRRGGEWVNVVQIGSNGVAATEFYQPLDRGMRWFVAPAAELRGERQTIWLEGQEVADYRLESALARLDAGLVLGSWGELRTGIYWGHVRREPKVGLPTLPFLSAHEGGVAASFRVDTLDTTAFPSRGTQIVARWQRSHATLGADAPFESAGFSANKPLTKGRDTFVPGFELTATRFSEGTIRGVASLGGFLRLSGLGAREVLGDDAFLGRLVYYRQLTRVNFGAISPRVYLGLALEAGNVYNNGNAITWPTLRYGGAIFVGAETLFGPAYLAWGWTEPDRQRIYLTIGERF